MLKEKKISPEDMDLVQVIDDPKKALRHIQKYVVL